MSGLANNRMNLTRSAPPTDCRGPCRLSACYPGAQRPGRSVAGLAAALLFAIVGGAYSPHDDLCGNNAVGEYDSPDGRKKAIVFVSNCDATGPTQVLLTPKPRDGEVFFLRLVPQGNTFVVEGSDVEARWLGNDRLILTYHPGAKVLRQESRVLGVAVEYRKEPLT